MSNEDRTRLSSPLVNRSTGTSAPARHARGEAVEHGFHAPFNASSSGSSFPRVSSLMSRDISRSNPPGFTGLPPSTGLHSWALHPPPQGTSSLQSQTTSSFFIPGAVGAQPHFATHAPGPQMTPGYSDQPASIPPRTQLTFSAHPSPAQLAPRPLYARYNSFPGQYVMPSHVPPSQNQPSQPPTYHTYHLLDSPYPPTQYYPLPPQPPPPYFLHAARVQGSHPSHQQIQRPSQPTHQSTTSVPGLLYPPPPYSSTGHSELPQLHQRSVHHHSHHGRPGPSADTFPIQAQRHHPINYSHPRCQLPRRDFHALRVQPTDSVRLPSPGLAPGSSQVILAASRDTISPPAANSPEQLSLQEPSKIDTREASTSLAARTSRAYDRSLAHRHYHPNPPPTRSRWVMWVGNVPTDAGHDELWQFLKHSAVMSSDSEDSGRVQDSGVESIFLISRSNCAFVNYDSEEQLNRAITQFNGRKLRPDDRRCPTLVCRVHRKEDDLRAGVGAQRGVGVHTRHVKNQNQKDGKPAGGRTSLSKSRRQSVKISNPPPILPPSGDEETSKSDTVEGAVSLKAPTQSSSSYASTNSSFLMRHFPKRFFILKSLTQYDLDLSVQRGIWATQKHNEVILDQAFRTSKEVLLIFSVNKSGEFYGYARMASGMLRSAYSIISWAPRADPSPRTSSPPSSRLTVDDTVEQRKSPSRHIADTFTSGSRLAEATSSDETEDRATAASSPQVRSAPPALHRASRDPLRPDPPVRSRFSYPDGGGPTPQASQDPGPSSVMQPGSGRHLGVRPGERSRRGGIDDVDSPGSRLQPVVEKVHGGSSVEEDPQSALTTAQSETLPDRSEVQQGGASWGETFQIEWLRTERIPFHRTRHLRNPWNHGREIKVARDGTEVEPIVGQRLIDEWLTLAGAASRRGVQSVATAGPSG